MRAALRTLSLSLELAKPLTRTVVSRGDKDPRLFASAGWQF